jgi:hypothetical protein
MMDELKVPLYGLGNHDELVPHEKGPADEPPEVRGGGAFIGK